MGNSCSDTNYPNNFSSTATIQVSTPTLKANSSKALLRETNLVAVPQSSYMVKECLKDIGNKKIRKIIFATCPLRGWFVNHWALIFEREDSRFLTVQFVKSGLDI